MELSPKSIRVVGSGWECVCKTSLEVYPSISQISSFEKPFVGFRSKRMGRLTLGVSL
jgi:hypothetical protein